MFSKTVDFFQELVSCLVLISLKLLLKVLNSLLYSQQQKKFQLYQLILWIDEWIIKSMKARYFTDRKMSFLVYE